MRHEARAFHSARHNRPPPPPLSTNCALFLDIDGTLAELVDNPRDVRIDAAVAAALPRLAQSLDGALALITGRAITDADRLFPRLKLPLAGQHGCERRGADGVIHLCTPHPETLDRLRALARGLAARHPGVLFEDKGATLALHYRGSPHLALQLRRALRSSLDDADDTDGYTLQRGKMLLEVRPENRDKGTAIRDFMAEAPFAGRLPVFLGDDRTDEHGFAAVEALGGWSIKVGQGATRAHFRLANIAAVRRWLLTAPEGVSRTAPSSAQRAS
jgi:trehalose 6-phosphate phosphatase